MAAEQTLATKDWFQGTADAVRKNMVHYGTEQPDAFLILSGDHLYRMDYRDILKFHMEKKADVTIATVPVHKKDVSGFGIMQINAGAQIIAFREKPSPTERIRDFVIPETIRRIFKVKGKEELYLASMGVYIFEPKALKAALAGNEADFGKEVIPKAIGKFNVYGYVFNDYWRDIGTIRSYYDVNIELTKPNPPFSFLSSQGRLFTRSRFLPPSRIINANFSNAVMTEGCYLDGVHVEDSIIGLRSYILKGSVIRKSVVIGNDFYELDKPKGQPALGIGKNCQIEHAILDKNVRIGNNVSISNKEKIEEKDGENYYIRDGIVIIPKGAVVRDGTKI
ncbi:MAG: sugar phosphate nucleotidyltransferase [Candidatus Omnitrophica bacterium]|nr:sugar phosphate nucleotidyltransferase [Candidatus Omnitrophota bacterium]